jgi:GLPGLI family protein
MKTIVCLWIFLFSAQHLFAQNLEGVIHYTREVSWVKIQETLPYLSKEEKDRAKLTWGDDTWKTKYLLNFADSKCLYEAAPDANKYETYSWRPPVFSYFQNFSEQKRVIVEETLGKTYTVDDSIVCYRWRIQNKMKEVAGKICLLAVAEDTVKKQKIEAWFAQDMPVSGGPELFCGLPGMILEININNGCVLITAEKIEMKKLEVAPKPAKKKGKKVTNTEFNDLIAKHIKDCIKSYRNPYWALRY